MRRDDGRVDLFWVFLMGIWGFGAGLTVGWMLT